MKVGAHAAGSAGCEFVVWAPSREKVELKFVSPVTRTVPMERSGDGYWKASVAGSSAGSRYLYRLDGERERPDPASSFQPLGVHGPSEVVDHSSFKWRDEGWACPPVSRMVFYELHVGTFTPEGTFDAVAPRLSELSELGVNALELMPVAQFPGDRNWGYDGVYPFAVQSSYGGPEGLRRLVDECHRKGLAVFLDVVYNHLGPEGNYLWDYGPYFTDRYRTPWGWAINYDGARSNGVRNYFIENALHWLGHYHIDGLRLDAIHGITDMSARPFLLELGERVEEFSSPEGRRYHIIAESDLNDSKVIRPREMGGYGFDAVWCDDFHHCLHALLTGERDGYYADFGEVVQMAKSLREGFVYSGQYSRYRLRNHGNSSKDRPAGQFLAFSQNHDQVGNRMLGERLSSLVSFESLKLAAGIVLLSPFVPLLFMGEEYGEEAPFLYFVSHSDPGLAEAVRNGRRKEFAAFHRMGQPPDPQDADTFLRSAVRWEKRNSGRHGLLLNLYRKLLKMRKDIPALSNLDKKSMEVVAVEKEKVVSMSRWHGGSHVLAVFNFGEADVPLSLGEGQWRKALESAAAEWDGPGSLCAGLAGGEIMLRGRSFAVFERGAEN